MHGIFISALRHCVGETARQFGISQSGSLNSCFSDSQAPNQG